MVTGARGMLGTDLVALLRREGEQVAALGRAELDVRDVRAVAEAVRLHKPDAVVNCAGWTAVDDAEAHEAEALAVNGHAVRALAEGCAELGARLVQVSTDYVFDGTARRPYREDDPTGPVGAYGRSKLAGERAALERDHLVVRTAWLYGAHGANFVRTMIRLEAERETVSVVDDQHGQPTWTADLAAELVRLVRADAAPGVHHAVNAGRTTWYGLAREVFTLLGADPERVRPVTTAEFPRPARRPAYSVLGRRTGPALRDWRDALHTAWPSLTGGAP
nr:dTDP-4-dehydrorhamnose reductase [Planomonospora venezuelensis]